VPSVPGKDDPAFIEILDEVLKFKLSLPITLAPELLTKEALIVSAVEEETSRVPLLVKSPTPILIVNVPVPAVMVPLLTRLYASYVLTTVTVASFPKGIVVPLFIVIVRL
jgi:hypothetical protein